MSVWYPPHNAPPFGSSGESASTGAASAIATTAQTDIGPDLTVAANTAQAGVAYYYEAVLNYTAAGTAGDITTTVQPMWGGTGGASLVNQVITNTAGQVTDGVWTVRVFGYIYFVSTSSCQTSIFTQGGYTPGNVSSALLGSVGYYTQTGLTTNVDKVLTVSLQFGAITGSPSVTPEFAAAWRVA